jgi:hypothetical protein
MLCPFRHPRARFRRRAGMRCVFLLASVIAAVSCSSSQGDRDGAASPCVAPQELQYIQPGCDSAKATCGPPVDPTCAMVACSCGDTTFLRCESPEIPFAAASPCERDRRCMQLSETECAADLGCRAARGLSPDDYCKSDRQKLVYAGCVGFLACKTAITWATDPRTGRELVFYDSCIPIGWKQIPNRCPGI